MLWEPILLNVVSDNLFFFTPLTVLSANYILMSILVGQLVIFIGLFGILRRTTSILLVLLCFELVLVGLNYSIICLGLLLNQPICLILSMIFLILSAVETAIGLSLVFIYYNVFKTTTLQLLMKFRF